MTIVEKMKKRIMVADTDTGRELAAKIEDLKEDVYKRQALFHCTFEKQIVIGILKKVAFGLEWVLAGKGVATVKWDGACCAIIGGEFYK